MKQQTIYLIALWLFLTINGNLYAQIQRASLNFSNSNTTRNLEIQTQQGSVTLKGSEGEAVLIEAQEVIPIGAGGQVRSQERDSPSLFVASEQGNQMLIKTTSENIVNLTLEVPKNISLKINVLAQGDVSLNNTTGFAEINTQQGNVTLLKVSGWAVVQAIDGNIQADFEQVPQGKTMAFASLNGNIILHFPKNLQATLRLKSNNQNISNEFAQTTESNDQPYLSFDIQDEIEKKSIVKNEEKEDSGFLQEETKINDATPQKNNAKKQKPQNKDIVPTQSQGDKADNMIAERKEPQPQNQRNSTTWEQKANGGGVIFLITTFNGEIHIYKKKR